MGDREPNRTTSGTLQPVLSQSSIFGQNPKIGCQEFNDLQTPKLSKKQLCDRTAMDRRRGIMCQNHLSAQPYATVLLIITNGASRDGDDVASTKDGTHNNR